MKIALVQQCRDRLGAGLWFVSIALLPLDANAREWLVLSDRSGHASTISAAMDSAQVGDTVLVGPGIYTWTSEQATGHSMIHMKPGVTLRSTHGAKATTLDAEGQGRVIVFLLPGEARIEGLTIENGVGVPFDGTRTSSGGGIFALENSRPTIIDCIVRQCRAWAGGGIACEAGGASIDGCTVENNESTFLLAGGGMACTGATISNCIVRNNFSFGSAGGLYVWDSIVTDCVIEDNRSQTGSGSGGGGARGAGGSVFERCLFRRNAVIAPSTNATGGGLCASGAVVVRECTFVDNFISGAVRAFGAAIGGSSGADLRVEQCTLVGNEAVAGLEAYGGLHINSDATGIVANSIIAWNDGIGAWGATTRFTCTNIYGNSLGDNVVGMDGGDNFSADPQFCAVNPRNSGFVGIQEDSPCAPGNTESSGRCGLVGAGKVECGSVSVKRRAWGEVKGLYRGR